MKKININDAISGLMHNENFCETETGKIIENCAKIKKSFTELLKEGGRGCTKCKRNSIIRKFRSKISPSIEAYNLKIDKKEPGKGDVIKI